MNLVIIPIDGAVYVDGLCYSNLNLSGVPSNVHALQWKSTKGWIEFKENDDGDKLPNEVITELPEWANLCKAKWDEAKVNEAKVNEEAAILAANQANLIETTGTTEVPQ
jgi:hypothetical protein